MYEVGQKVKWLNKFGHIIKITGRYLHVQFNSMGVGSYKFNLDGICVNGSLEKLEVVE